jgi:hypothetical protein
MRKTLLVALLLFPLAGWAQAPVPGALIQLGPVHTKSMILG